MLVAGFNCFFRACTDNPFHIPLQNQQQICYYICMNNILTALLIWNLCVFFIYAADKRRARKRMWRVSEKALLICSFLCGGIGAMAGMHCLRHKTRHLKFRILVPLSAIFTIIAAYFLFISE